MIVEPSFFVITLIIELIRLLKANHRVDVAENIRLLLDEPSQFFILR